MSTLLMVALTCAALMPIGCTTIGGDMAGLGELLEFVVETVDAVTDEACPAMADFVKEAYSTGDVSLTGGGVFTRGIDEDAGYCAELQLRGHCSRQVTFDMGVLGYSVGDGEVTPRMWGTMLTLALGGDTKLLVTGEKKLPFRVGVSGVVAFPLTAESSGGECWFSPLGGAKLRIDWVPVTDWRDPWASGLLEVSTLAGVVLGPGVGLRDGEAVLVTVVKGGIQCAW